MPRIQSFYLHEALFSLGDGLMVFLGPAFILSVTHSAAGAFLWSAAWPLLILGLIVPTSRLLLRSRTPAFWLGVGIVFYMIWTLLWLAAEKARWFLVPAALASALYCCFYWLTRHYLMSVTVTRSRVGRQMSIISIIRIVTGILVPSVGGLLAQWYPWYVILTVGAFFAAASLIPMRGSTTALSLPMPSLAQIRSAFSQSPYREATTSYILDGVCETCFPIALSIYYLTHVGSIGQFGLVSGVAALVAIVGTRAMGHLFDHRNSDKAWTILVTAYTASILAYAALPWSPTPTLFLILDSFRRPIVSLRGTLFGGIVFSTAAQYDPVLAHLHRELALNSARVVTGLVMASTYFLFPDQAFLIALCIASLAQFGTRHLRNASRLLRA